MKKLTKEVFDLPECPKEATIAVLNRSGNLYFGTYKKVLKDDAPGQSGDGGWIGGGDGKWFFPGVPGYDGTTYPVGCKILRKATK